MYREYSIHFIQIDCITCLIFSMILSQNYNCYGVTTLHNMCRYWSRRYKPFLSIVSHPIFVVVRIVVTFILLISLYNNVSLYLSDPLTRIPLSTQLLWIRFLVLMDVRSTGEDIHFTFDFCLGVLCRFKFLYQDCVVLIYTVDVTFYSRFMV